MIEQFARLNAGTQTFNSSGHWPLLDEVDLCGILARLSDKHSWYVYAMIDQRRSYNMDLLHRYFTQVVLQEMLRKKYRSEKVKASEFAYGVTKAVIHAHFNPKGKCGYCNGIGRIGTSLCSKCLGSGVKMHNWSEKLNYGFPMRSDLSRKWYRVSCGYYDQFIESFLIEIRSDLIESLHQHKLIEKAYRREVNECLFDEL